MTIEGPKLSPGKGRWSKDPIKQARRRRNLDAATRYRCAIDRVGGFNRSKGAASDAVEIDPSSAEFAAIAAKYGITAAE